MTTNKPPGHQAGDAVHVRTSSAAHAADAQRRRLTLRRLLELNGLRPAELARRIGMPNPNALYNLLNGHSSSLSQRYIERIIALYPGAEAEALVLVRKPSAEDSADRSRQDHVRVPIVMQVQSGHLQDVATPSDGMTETVWLPISFAQTKKTLFGVRVLSPGAERLMAEGSVAICEPVDNTRTLYPAGTLLIVEDILPDGIEVSVRKVVYREGRLWLWSLSNDPDRLHPLPAPWDLVDPAHPDAIRVRLVGRVIATIRHEPHDPDD